MDRIIYVVIDGDDRDVREATFSKDAAYESASVSGAVQLTVRDPDKVGKALLSKMTPVERLCLQNRDLTDDTIVYVTVGNPGGVDGRDISDKGGGLRFASFDREAAERKVDGWSSLGKPRVVVPSEVAQEALSRLDPVELLCLESHMDNLASAPAPRRPRS